MNSVSISPDNNSTITAGPFNKLDLHRGVYKIAIWNDYGGYNQETEVFLEREELLSLGYGLLAMCGVSV